MVHEGVDGHSHLIVFLKCSNNNRSSTALQSFVSAVQELGLPDRIRCDRICVHLCIQLNLAIPSL